MNDLARIPARDLYQHPDLMAEAVKVAEQLARTAALMRRWPEMERAIDVLIERQRVIVTWWADNVRGIGRPEKVPAPETILAAKDAQRLTGLHKRQVSRIRTALERPGHRERLIAEARRFSLAERTNADPNATRATPEREGPDFWPTPESLAWALTHHLLPRLPAGPIWECACGDGRLVTAMQRVGRTVFGSDRYPADPGLLPRDFLDTDPPGNGCLIVTNPPFNIVDDFIQRGLDLIDEGKAAGMVLLLRHDHLTAGGRAAWLNRATLEVHCNWRPTWIDGSDGQPRWSFCWVTWLPVAQRVAPIYLAEAPA